MNRPIRLCHLSDIEDGDARGFDPHQQGHDSLFVIRQHRQVIGYRNACPHKGYEGTSMAWRKDRFLNKAHSRVICAAHGAQFDINSGECLLGPCPGQSLDRLPLLVNEQGDVYLLPADSEK
ncbi:Rieske (2Fe-2S) protein [Oceanobacter mangrovi]|uniref:Rieske (2Fe-2S) protein n=1 Tax=Oceanobacter mangrovi TaxID=2862510 RepID=UPI001C8D287C|nr:Rieske 2Fe-2S domain-containing protein [Oceanobacter mangrovi]